MGFDLAVKRVYEAPAPYDGQRVLVDRIWPRGVSKEGAALTAWLKEIAPSDELRNGSGMSRCVGRSFGSGMRPSWMGMARRWRSCAACSARAG